MRRKGTYKLAGAVQFCSDCGAEGERRGHQTCAYPSDREDARERGLEPWARRYDELNGAPENEGDR